MAWPKNNRYWKNVDFKNPPKYESANDLWEKAKEYFEFNEKRRWIKQDFVKSGEGAGKIIDMELPNPPSIGAFCIFANISQSTFNNYSNKKDEWLVVTDVIREIIYAIQFEGATVNLFNANIIARKIGLTDKKEVELKTDLSDDERKELIKQIIKDAKGESL